MLVESSRNLPLISFKRNKNTGNFFLARSEFQTSDQPGSFNCARLRCKTCPFIRSVEKVSGPKRAITITDHFTCTSSNVIYCITYTLCKKLYICESGRRPGDRFWNPIVTWGKTIKTHLNRLRDTLISPIIVHNICQCATFPYIKEARKAAN